MGYSRGAATANLTSILLGQKDGVNRENIFTYAGGTSAYAMDATPDESLDNIFNIINSGDLVPMVPAKNWGFSVLGTTVPLNPLTDENRLDFERCFYDVAGTNYYGQSDYTQISTQLVDLITTPSQSASYFNTRQAYAQQLQAVLQSLFNRDQDGELNVSEIDNILTCEGTNASFCVETMENLFANIDSDNTEELFFGIVAISNGLSNAIEYWGKVEGSHNAELLQNIYSLFNEVIGIVLAGESDTRYLVLQTVQEAIVTGIASPLLFQHWPELYIARMQAKNSDQLFTINYTTETIEIKSGYEVSTTESFDTELTSVAAICPDSHYYIRTAATDSTPASAAVSFSTSSRQAAPTTLTMTGETSLNAKDGKLSGISTAMEYKIGNGQWISGDGNGVTGFSDETVSVRMKATETDFAGLAQTFIFSTSSVTAISGTVRKAGTPAPGATVKLCRCNEIYAMATTDDNGDYRFYASPGVYNLVATYEGTTKTELVTITDSNQSGVDILLPDANVNSQLNVTGDNTPNVVVGGLDEEAAALKTDNVTSVTVQMTVESKNAEDIPHEDRTGIETQADGQLLSFLEINVAKTIDANPPESVTNTGNLMEIIIPFDLSGKTDVSVYSRHGDETMTFRRIFTESNKDNQTFYLDTENNLIHVYSKAFCTFALGYHTAPTITFQASGGSVDTTTVQTDLNGRLTSLPTPTRSGYRFDGWYLNGELVTLDTVFTGDATITAQWTRNSSVTVPYDPMQTGLPFTDVTNLKWFFGDVKYVYENKLMLGAGDTAFKPYLPTNRGMIVTILWRLDNEPEATKAVPFTDVPEDKYYHDAVAWAAENKIVNGYDAKTFGPEDHMTREQLAAIFLRYAEYKGYDVSAGEETNILSYTDAQSIADWAFSAMQWACEVGLIQGDAGKLMPKGKAQRCQVAAILHRFCEKFVK